MKNDIMKKLGKGFVYGLKHPFEDHKKTYYKLNHGERPWDEVILEDIGMNASQGTIQSLYGIIGAIGVVLLIGYINSKIKEMPVDVRMVVDKKEPEKEEDK